MVAYTNREDLQRLPMFPLRRGTPYNIGERFGVVYSGLLGSIEFVRTETTRYADGI